MLELYPSLMITQQVESLQVFSGIETGNKYRIVDMDGADVAYAYEESGFLARQVLRNHRPMSIRLMDAQGTVLLTASRRFFWFLSHLEMEGPGTVRAGRIDRRLKFPGRRYEVSDGQGTTLELMGPPFRPHTFKLMRDGVEVGRITKRWSGARREIFTTADTFQVVFESQEDGAPSPLAPLSEAMRWVMLGAAIVIDLDFFDSRTRRGGR